MRQATIDTQPYRELAEHLPRGRSLRELAASLGRSHEYWRAQIARESGALVEECEAHLRRGVKPLFVIPPMPLSEWQQSLTLAQYVVDQLRARGWVVCARGLPAEVDAGIAIEIVFEEE